MPRVGVNYSQSVDRESLRLQQRQHGRDGMGWDGGRSVVQPKNRDGYFSLSPHHFLYIYF